MIKTVPSTIKFYDVCGGGVLRTCEEEKRWENNFLKDKCPFIHEEMARKNIIICSNNTELKNLG